MLKPLAISLLVLTVGPCTDYADFHWLGGGAGGQGGSGGTGGTTVPFCTPGEQRECYTGPTAAKGVGICKSGLETCNEEGTAFGPCEGEVWPQAEDCGTPDDEDCNGVADVCSGGVLWAKRFGDELSQFARAVGVDAAGNIFVGGAFLGSVSFGGDTLTSDGGSFYTDAFVAKLDAQGAPIWSRRFGESLSQRLRGLAVAGASDVVVAGDYEGEVSFGDKKYTSSGGTDAFVAKLDGAGAVLWSKSFGGPDSQLAYAIAADAGGDTLVAGSFGTAIDFGNGPQAATSGKDAFLVKLDKDGTVLWSRLFGGVGDQSISAVAFDAQGNILLGGSFNGEIAFDDGPYASAGGWDVWSAKLGPSGDTMWSTAYGGGGDELAFAATTDPAGNLFLAGSFTGSINFGDGPNASAGGSDVFLVKLGPDAAPLWSARFGDEKDLQTAYALGTDSFGNVVVAGAFDGSLTFGDALLSSGGASDMFVAKLSAGGAALWARRFGDTGTQVATALARDTTGGVVMAGYLAGAVDIGSMTVTSVGAEDIVVIKLAP